VIFFACILLMGCKKSFLEEKPNRALLVPITIKDFEAILEHVTVMNTTVGLPNVASDDFFRSDANLASMTGLVVNTHLWREDIFSDQASNDWDLPYKTVFYANVTLDGIANIGRSPQNQVEWDNLKGNALFFRSMAFFHLSQMFAPHYTRGNAAQLSGIPLPLGSNVNKIYGRGTLEQTYQQMISDFTQAIPLLPEKPKRTNLASKCAAYAYLARVYLIMEDYVMANKFAKDYLAITDKLIDFNLLNAAVARPFPDGGPTNANVEVLFALYMNGYAYDSSVTTFVNPDVYAQFEDNDLRKTCFFANRGGGNFTFKGSYFGSTSSFGGVATDEIYLIAAECEARLQNKDAALAILDALLVTRWSKTGNLTTYVKKTAADAKVALALVLKERRKELLTRGLRWSDLRRLNEETDQAVTLSRNFQSQTYMLLPKSPKYVFPIPLNEILASGIEQNPR